MPRFCPEFYLSEAHNVKDCKVCQALIRQLNDQIVEANKKWSKN